MSSSIISIQQLLRVIPAIVIGASWLFLSAFSAHAATPDQFAHMQAQLMHASAQLEQFVTTQGLVLGSVNTNDAVTLALLQAKLTLLENNIASLQSERDTVAAQMLQMQASTVATSTLVVKPSTLNPLASTLILRSTASSDWMNVFSFDVQNDSMSDLVSVDTVQIGLPIVHSQGGFNALVSGATLEMNGITFTKYKLMGSTTTDGVAMLVFNVSGNEIIKAGSQVPVTFRLRFKALSSANEGATIKARVSVGNIKAHVLTPSGTNTSSFKSAGTVIGNSMTLQTKGMLVAPITSNVVVTTAAISGQHDYVTYTMKFDVTAFNQDVYLDKNVFKSVAYTMVDGAGTAVGTSSTIATLIANSNTSSSGLYYVVRDGTTATLTLIVTWTPGGAAAARGLQLNGLNYANSPALATNTWSPNTLKDFRTSMKATIN